MISMLAGWKYILYVCAVFGIAANIAVISINIKNASSLPARIFIALNFIDLFICLTIIAGLLITRERNHWMLIVFTFFVANPATCTWTCCILVVRLISIKDPFYQIREQRFWLISLPITFVFPSATLALYYLVRYQFRRYDLLRPLECTQQVILTVCTLVSNIWTYRILVKNPSGSEEAGRRRRRAAMTAMLLMTINLLSCSIFLISEATLFILLKTGAYDIGEDPNRLEIAAALRFLYTLPLSSILNPVILYIRGKNSLYHCCCGDAMAISSKSTRSDKVQSSI